MFRAESPASEPLRRFLQVARGAGLRVSAAEGIDAARAVDVVGFADRTVLKDTLALVLAKTPDEKSLFDECFDLYFRRDEFFGSTSRNHRRPPMPGEPQPSRWPAATAWAAAAAARSATLLLNDDRATLATAMEQAAREAGLENIRFFTQKNLYARRILDRMGLRALEREIEALRQTGGPDRSTRADRLAGAARLSARRRCATSSSATWCCSPAARPKKFREELLKSARLSNLERRDLDRMRVLVRAMAKRLAARYAKTRRRRLRGQLDTRRTLRRNMGWGGVPFITVWKQKRIEKPRVMVLCDVSGSVAPMAQFLLMFLYAVNEALSDIRSFAFAGSLIEVSDILDKEDDRSRHRQDHADDRLRLVELRQFAGGFRGRLGHARHQQDDDHHPGRRARQPHRSAGGDHAAPVVAGEADHLAEPGIPVRAGAPAIRTCTATSRSAAW